MLVLPAGPSRLIAVWRKVAMTCSGDASCGGRSAPASEHWRHAEVSQGADRPIGSSESGAVGRIDWLVAVDNHHPGHLTGRSRTADDWIHRRTRPTHPASAPALVSCPKCPRGTCTERTRSGEFPIAS